MNSGKSLLTVFSRGFIWPSSSWCRLPSGPSSFRALASISSSTEAGAQRDEQQLTPEERNQRAHEQLRVQYEAAQEAGGKQSHAEGSVEEKDADDEKKKKKKDKAQQQASVSVASIPRRAVMYVPGDDEKKLAKIAHLRVDCPVLECEDGVAFLRKETARNLIVQTLNRAPWVRQRLSQGRDVAVRVNALASGLAEADLAAVLSAEQLPSTLLIPKVEDKDDVEHIAHLLQQQLAARATPLVSPLRLIMYTESARALLSLQKTLKTALKLADKSEGLFRVDGMVLGSDDLCADMGARRSKEADELVFARQHFLAVVKSFQRQLQAIDLVYIDYKDAAGLQRQAEEGARWGFTGKQVIHPGQIDAVQAAFAPSQDQVQWAQQLTAAFQQHQQQGKGAFVFRDSMIDMPLLLQARNILQQHEVFSKQQEQAATSAQQSASNTTKSPSKPG
ncbi:citramalyl-CoA lyase, mitochondrial-like [Paramacrobiotus metropolitanus]|uniref:citramalyl-CoA lyase, mitochondrial-like n=1 Tax=Paramacrobiotus metropolitanus TaxID=2943436 RepID=UPI002445E36D|nr:citramalyl-CoA lyase, mitochondrial-like [Paramacrobiotus metropolitanus]